MSLREEWTVFRLAVQFLTRLPVGEPAWSAERMALTPRWYPGVGILVGLISGAAFWAGAPVSPLFAGVAAVAAGVLATGAFHEDGFADMCDGLGGGATRERALEIMRDSRLGTYGVLGIGLLLAGKVAALAVMGPWTAAAALVAAHAGGRLSAVLVMATAPYVRDHGTAKPVERGAPGWGLGASVAAAALVPAALLVPWGAAAALALLALSHRLVRRRFERRLGGYTGDCLGAVEQAGELAVLAGIAACL
ncbi:cobalamin-5'-phosphate synthase [Hasllibacter halocynthiae]|uniref:Adenosylcobinamide-GDP ribazoletransferase n=1 Tax=Hasllibacter halocynthiae TaxID=595589 RepID=A0A2T0X420_9RHOB|nr:adenosylcobinamide-GDP ribazoletransferase [Hasllibacter halocynthiae]PRY93696.1 cobalamin-5'-phosphate synthase [Hasllibacter halocynthiae]